MNIDALNLIRQALGDDRHCGYIQAQARSIPHPGNRLWFAQWAKHLAETPKRNGERRSPASIYRYLHGITLYLIQLDQTAIEQATQTDFHRIWINAIDAPTRTFEQCQKGALTPQVRTEYQRRCHEFVAWALGEPAAQAKARHLPVQHTGDDVVEQVVPWSKLLEIQEDLQGTNRALFTLLTASGLSGGEIRGLPVDCISYHDSMCIINCPPTKSFPQGRVVPLHHGDEIIAAYQSTIRRNNPGQRLLFPRKRYPSKPLTSMDVYVRIKKWGKRAGVEGLNAKRLRLTYLCYLLARGDVSEYFVMHVMGVRKSDPVQALKRSVEEAKLRGHDFGQPATPANRHLPGRWACYACGKADNATTAALCGGCGTPAPDRQDARASRVLSDLQDLMNRLQDITHASRNDRAELALGLLESERPEESS